MEELPTLGPSIASHRWNCSLLSWDLTRPSAFLVRHRCRETGKWFQEEGRRGVMEGETDTLVESILPQKLQHNQMWRCHRTSSRSNCPWKVKKFKGMNLSVLWVFSNTLPTETLDKKRSNILLMWVIPWFGQRCFFGILTRFYIRQLSKTEKENDSLVEIYMWEQRTSLPGLVTDVSSLCSLVLSRQPANAALALQEVGSFVMRSTSA